MASTFPAWPVLRALGHACSAVTCPRQAGFGARTAFWGCWWPSLKKVQQILDTLGRRFCAPSDIAEVPSCPSQEVNDEMVRQHFSKWGTVNDVYFPR